MQKETLEAILERFIFVYLFKTFFLIQIIFFAKKERLELVVSKRKCYLCIVR